MKKYAQWYTKAKHSSQCNGEDAKALGKGYFEGRVDYRLVNDL